MDEQPMVTEGLSQEGYPTLEDSAESYNTQQLELFDMQKMAVTNTGSIAQLQNQLKTANEMLKDTFKNNATFKEHEDRVKEVQKGLKSVKAEIDRQPSTVAQKQKIKELKNEIKEKRDVVTEYALESYRLTGIREIEFEGEVYDIQTVAKLTKRKQ